MSIVKFVNVYNDAPEVTVEMHNYLSDDLKTDSGKYIDGLGFITNNYLDEFNAVKVASQKTCGNQFKQITISLSPAGNPCSDEEYMQIGLEIAQPLYDKGFQVLIYLHKDTDTRHLHFMMNTVSFITGKMFTQSKSELNRFKLHCNHVFTNHKLEPIRKATEAMLDTEMHDIGNGFDFLEAYDEIMADNAACLIDMLEQAPSLGYTPAMTEEESLRWTNPDYPTDGYNRFFGYNYPLYNEYWNIGCNDHRHSICNGSYFEPNKIRPISLPCKDDFLPPPIIIREGSSALSNNDEYYFSESGALLKINCSREYVLNIPDGYSEEQVRKIVDSLPRISDEDKNKLTKRATAASGTLKRHKIDGQVELDLSETIKFNWSDGTSTTIHRPIPSNENEITEVIDVDGEEID